MPVSLGVIILTQLYMFLIAKLMKDTIRFSFPFPCLSLFVIYGLWHELVS